jgi:hypothetical protein
VVRLGPNRRWSAALRSSPATAQASGRSRRSREGPGQWKDMASLWCPSLAVVVHAAVAADRLGNTAVVWKGDDADLAVLC